MPLPDWDQRYAAGDLPWDTGQPDPHLIEVVRALKPGRALEVGSGTGTNALWLAEQGFEVLGVDLSARAVERARSRVKGQRARFEVADFLRDEVPGRFDLVFDRGCFHVFDDAPEQSRFAERVARVLEPAGVWASLIGSTEGAPRDTGPPRRSARDIVAAIEPHLAIAELRATTIVPGGPPAWICLARPRKEPAQPSTRF